MFLLAKGSKMSLTMRTQQHLQHPIPKSVAHFETIRLETILNQLHRLINSFDGPNFVLNSKFVLIILSSIFLGFHSLALGQLER